MVDLTGNLVMARGEFDILYDVREISQVKLVELESLAAKSQALDKPKLLLKISFLLLRLTTIKRQQK